MIIHYIGARMKISEKLDKLKNEKLEACEALKTSIKELSKSKDKEDSKIQEALMNMWADLNNQIEEMEMMIESLQVISR